MFLFRININYLVYFVSWKYYLYICVNIKTNNMNELKLNKIEKLENGFVEIAHITLKIKTINNVINYDIISTGSIIRVKSSHLTDELSILLEWLKKPSSNEDNLRTNESEILIFALDMFKANKKLNDAFKI